MELPIHRRLKTVYKITYPNGKIYIGKDLVHNVNYFGSASGELIGADFTLQEQLDFTIRKEILWHSVDATDQEVNRREVEFIRQHGSNNPAIGYNKWPPFRDGVA
jgi:hypothetical protein